MANDLGRNAIAVLDQHLDDMARDVERALVDVAGQWGARSTEDAIAFVAGLKKAGRYQADVY